MARFAWASLLWPALLCTNHPAAAANRNPPVISVDTRRNELRIDGTSVGGLSLRAIRAVLGEPRTVTRVTRQRYEEFGYKGSPPHSEQVKVTNHHYVYDQLGLVFTTSNDRWDSNRTPAMLYVVYGKSREPHNEDPAIIPQRPFAGTLRINGQRLDPARDPVPKGVDYRTKKFSLLGTTCGPTSRAGRINGIYCYDGSPVLDVILLGEGKLLVAYVRIRQR